MSPDGSRLVMQGDQGIVRVHDAQTGQEVLTLKAPVLLRSGSFSPDGLHIATEGDDGVVRVYDARTGEEGLILKGPAPFFLAGFSPDGTRIAARQQGGDGVVRVYDSRTGREAFAIQGHGPEQMEFTPDGSRFAMVRHDGRVAVCDGWTGEETLVLPTPDGKVDLGLGSAKFSPDGSRLAVAGPKSQLCVWTAPQDLAAWQAERRAAFPASLPFWHRAQAKDRESAGDWFGAAFHLGYLIDAEPNAGLDHLRRGVALTQLGRATEADREFAKARALKADLAEVTAAAWWQARAQRWDAASRYYAWAAQSPDASTAICCWLALSRLAREDRAGYEAACADIVQRFGQSKNRGEANDVAWICTLAPTALRDFQPALAAARIGIPPSLENPEVRNPLGPILYRAGQDAEAVKELNEAIRLSKVGGTWFDFLFLAMAHHRIGKPAEAKTWLQKAQEAHAKPPQSGFWVHRLEWELLQREAEALLKEPPPDPKK
jgi:tetratricopeptide (TPR) repeat protein